MIAVVGEGEGNSSMHTRAGAATLDQPSGSSSLGSGDPHGQLDQLRSLFDKGHYRIFQQSTRDDAARLARSWLSRCLGLVAGDLERRGRSLRVVVAINPVTQPRLDPVLDSTLEPP